MKYIYTALISQDNGGFVARVPDIPACITTGQTLSDVIAQITDAAAGCLVVAEDEGLSIAQARSQDDLPREPGDICTLIQIDTLAYRAATETKAVRKNVSLPAWMATLADKRGMNCSQILQEALLSRFDNPIFSRAKDGRTITSLL